MIPRQITLNLKVSNPLKKSKRKLRIGVVPNLVEMNPTISIKRSKDLDGDNDCETSKKPKITQDDILVSEEDEATVAET